MSQYRFGRSLSIDSCFFYVMHFIGLICIFNSNFFILFLLPATAYIIDFHIYPDSVQWFKRSAGLRVTNSPNFAISLFIPTTCAFI